MRLAAIAPVVALAAALLAAGAASAQPVATAAGREGELTTAQQIDSWLSEAPPATSASRAGAGPGSPWGDAAGTTFTRRIIPIDGPPIARTLVDGQIHGEAGAEIGTAGYGGYGVVSGPLGKTGAIQIGVSHYEGNGGGRRGRGYGYGGDRTSLSLSAAFGVNRERAPDAPVIYTPAPATPAN